MTPRYARILVTGAGGFVGAKLSAALRAHPAFAGAALVLCDLALDEAGAGKTVTPIRGDFAEPEIRDRLLAEPVDLVFHLAGVLGGAAEQDVTAARRVNVDATLGLFEALRNPARPPRIVFASSIAVFGPPLPELIDDDTAPRPVMVYGAHKRMIEIAMEQFGARRWIDGLALRLPGIVARPGVDERLKSSFISAVFHAVAQGRDITLPVSPGGATWLLSAGACVDALIHAALLPAASPKQRAFTLPAQRIIFGDLVEALLRAYPASRSQVRFEPDAAVEAQFGIQPPLATPFADALGFRHDGDLATLVRRALEP